MRKIAPDWLSAPATQEILTALRPAAPLFVGGCVRDALLGRATHDVDLCVKTPPEETMRLARAAGIAAHPTGVAHGVVTLVKNSAAFEVATLRRDVATDGRRAIVAFSSDPAEDAARRDFTMNALYARPDGTVLDPLGTGLGDLEARRLRFIGVPAERIAEDYLRILRFFRFTATLQLTDLEEEALAACHAAAAGLSQISRERIGMEMRRLAAAPAPGLAFGAMGPILSAVLPGATFLPQLWEVEHAMGLPARAPRRLFALGLSPETLRARLRLSRIEENALKAISAATLATAPLAAQAWRHGPEATEDALAVMTAKGAPLPGGWRADIRRGASACFPLKGADLIADGHATGPHLGKTLQKLETQWVASGFTMHKTALLAAARK